MNKNSQNQGAAAGKSSLSASSASFNTKVKLIHQKSDKPFSPNFLVVGIGASAGGITALEQFFDHLPLPIAAGKVRGKNKNNSSLEIAFVVLTQLSLENESNLASTLQKHTSLETIQVAEPVLVQPGVIYVIPSRKKLTLEDGYIHLNDLEEQRNTYAPIDLFFRTLAQARTDWAGAIVLSGSSADGSVGIPRVKEMGGITLAQDPGETEYQQMSQSAIATGFVDAVLPVSRMGAWLVNYSQNRQKIVLPLPPSASVMDTEDSIEPVILHERVRDTKKLPGKKEKNPLLEILALLRVRTGCNFAPYKRATLTRRIERRLQLNDIPNLASYLTFLQTHSAEIPLLLHDLLISVTNFFRDREVWDYLQINVIPKLFQGKEDVDSVIRVWIAGCASGEEAHSMAILLHEYASRMATPPRLQIFASDLDDQAIGKAREGSYPETIALDVSSQRLERFFTHVGRRYQLKKELRESVLFAHHDLLKDPPFSRLDLVSCRNVAIYLSKEAQAQLLTLFHFALKPKGFLLLGTSESADAVPALFSTLDKNNHLYSRRHIKQGFAPLPPLQTPEPKRFAEIAEFSNPPVLRPPEKDALTYALQSQFQGLFVQAGVVIDEMDEIVYLSEPAGRYLQLGVGEPSFNFRRLVLPELRFELHTSLHQTRVETEKIAKTVKTNWVQLTLDGSDCLVRLVIRPISHLNNLQGYTLITFDEDEIEEVETNEVTGIPNSITSTLTSSSSSTTPEFLQKMLLESRL